jgi:hypothetical protein
MLLLAALAATPGATLILLGDLRHQPVLRVAGVVVGAAVGVLLCWWGGGSRPDGWASAARS